MKFGLLTPGEAVGAILAHSLRADGRTFKKGRLLTAEDAAVLEARGIGQVMAARPEAGDVAEDEAADRIASALAGDGITASPAFTGRANLLAGTQGLVVIDRARLERINLLHEAITVATLEPLALAEPRRIVATIKIIPFAAPRRAVEEAEALARSARPAILSLAVPRRHRAALIMTAHDGAKDSVIAKTRATIAARLEALGSHLAEDVQCRHDRTVVAEAISGCVARDFDPILLFGSSAIVDRRDVIPAAIEDAGGAVDHFGMPVDPGNLLLLGHHGATTVIGLPGCARSPKLNGFDWVLRRVLCGVPVGRDDIMGMGVGGLLKDFAGRPQPRAAPGLGQKTSGAAPRIAAVVLAAGRSRRMGGVNKLVADIDGRPMIATTVAAVLASRADPVIVVTGHQQDRIAAALAGQAVTFAHNPDYAEGLSTSLRTAMAALPGDIDGAVICLGDMPAIRPGHIDKLIAAFDPVEGRAICVPAFRGKHGNPVLWSAGFFAAIGALSGDAGAKHLIGENAELMCEVAIDEAAIFTDIDTPAALQAARGPNKHNSYDD